MRKMLILPSALFIAIASQGAPAQAQLNRTWVSGASTAADSNPCDRATPCASFSGAFGKTAAGGEITCLDNGNFGPVTINKSITINCEGAIGSNTSSTTSGVILVADTVVTDVVTLKGLDVDGLSFTATQSPIRFIGAGTLRLEKMKVSNIHGAASGVNFAPTGTAKLQVVDSIIANNGTSALAAGIYIKPASGIQASVAIERSVIENNGFGILADGTAGGTIKGIVSDSFVTGNVNNGISVSSTGTSVVLMIDNTKVANNAYGLVAQGINAAMLVSRSIVVANGTGLYTSGAGALYSYKDNKVNFNIPIGDGAFTNVVSVQ